MIDGIRLKVCGITSLVDADMADAVGADFLGFNLYPKSPRHLTLGQYGSMAQRLPPRKRVAVAVEPDAAALAGLREAAFDRFQIHFRAETPAETLRAWSSALGAERLWLAPRLPPGEEVCEAWLPLAEAFLVDTFDPALFGGTGRTGDWAGFRRQAGAHPEKTWILSGGLNPDNIGAALAGSGARFVDVNSGVEASPGVKDAARLAAFAAGLRRAAR
jgi:phosphoribosylanthranilate isomerase